jgi:GNAT superfamily N-acetyltransferase
MLPSIYSIRSATVTDARAIAEIHVHAWQAAYRGIMPESVLDSLSTDEREQFWLSVLETNARHNLVLEESARILGWAAFGPARDPDLDAQKIFELYGIYFHPLAWGHGLGRYLYKAAEEHMKRLPVEGVILWVLKENIRARKFYETMDFILEPNQIKVLEREETQLPEVRYQKKLIGSQE